MPSPMIFATKNVYSDAKPERIGGWGEWQRQRVATDSEGLFSCTPSYMHNLFPSFFPVVRSTWTSLPVGKSMRNKERWKKNTNNRVTVLASSCHGCRVHDRPFSSYPCPPPSPQFFYISPEVALLINTGLSNGVQGLCVSE